MTIITEFKEWVITGPPTDSVGDQTSDGRWFLSSLPVVVCNTPQRRNVTH